MSWFYKWRSLENRSGGECTPARFFIEQWLSVIGLWISIVFWTETVPRPSLIPLKNLGCRGKGRTRWPELRAVGLFPFYLCVCVRVDITWKLSEVWQRRHLCFMNITDYSREKGFSPYQWDKLREAWRGPNNTSVEFVRSQPLGTAPAPSAA